MIAVRLFILIGFLSASCDQRQLYSRVDIALVKQTSDDLIREYSEVLKRIKGKQKSNLLSRIFQAVTKRKADLQGTLP